MSEKLFDALETCLQAIEQGATLDEILARFPALAKDLRPILETSLHARTLADSPLPDGLQRRGRARLLQRASQMRETKRAPRRTWLYNFRPLAVTITLVFFLLSSTGLVSASSGALPGDHLYPVKRTWEDMRLLFTFGEENRETLTLNYENERQEETSELLAGGRVASVSFSGYVTAQTNIQWIVSGIPVSIAEQTVLPMEPLVVGSAVTVYGVTSADGHVDATSVAIVPAGTLVPTPKPEDGEKSPGPDPDPTHETETESPSGD